MANEPINLKGAKVLVVDDMPTNLDLLNQILEQEGYEVSFATEGETALKIATLDHPDVILLDVMMPGMDGFETCRRLKSIQSTRHIPVIFVTGKTDTRDVLEGFHIGAADYIVKPVRQEEVCARVRTHLQTQALIRIRDDLIEKLREHNQQNRQQMDRQRDQLIDASKLAQLGEMMAELTHEVSTPIGVGVTAVSNIEQEQRSLEQMIEADKLTRSRLDEFLGISREGLSIALSNLQTAAQLIQSFKRVTVDQCVERRSRFNLKTYIEQVLQTLSPKLKKTRHQVQIDCPDDLEPHSEPGALSQVLINLIDNSLSHGFADTDAGEILIRCARDGDDLVLDYQDNGVGIPAEQIDRIFERYYTSNREGGGTGLGLHICRCLVENSLNGQITCQSEPGQGSTFSIRCPLENAEP